MNRRDLLKTGAVLLTGAAGATFRSASAQETSAAQTQPPLQLAPGSSYTPVVTLNGSTLPWKMENAVKIFRT